MLEQLFFTVVAAFPILAILFAITFLSPTWHWPVGFIVIIGGMLTALWIQHWHAASLPGYKEGPGGALGIALVSLFSLAFVFASATFIGGLIWWHRRLGSGPPSPAVAELPGHAC